MTNDELERAVERLSDPDLAYDREGDLMGHLVDRDDLRALLSERAELLAAVERMRGALEEIVNVCPATCETSAAHSMADIARAALTTGEGK